MVANTIYNSKSRVSELYLYVYLMYIVYIRSFQIYIVYISKSV